MFLGNLKTHRVTLINQRSISRVLNKLSYFFYQNLSKLNLQRKLSKHRGLGHQDCLDL